MGHARALINVPEIDKQLYIFREIVKKGLSVRKTEELVREMQQASNRGVAKSTKSTPMSFQYQKVEDDLASKFSTRVRLTAPDKKGKGAIELPFHSEDDLNRHIDLLNRS